jgi:intracellular sulfur oxidation DsrE/DsrF family protein
LLLITNLINLLVVTPFFISPAKTSPFMKQEFTNTANRRGFLGKLAAGAAALGLGTVMTPIKTMAEPFSPQPGGDASDAWFSKLKGKHKMVFDATQPHGIFPFAWPRVFLMTNEMTGTPAKDNSVLVVLRHDAIPYAFEDRLWQKYNCGEMFKADDPATKMPATRNPFWKPAAGAYMVPGIGEVKIGINELQDSGVMFCVCNAAMTVYSAVAAQKMNLKADDVLKDWTSGLLPGIHVVPSGVWAIGRAQEQGCSYCFAG